MRHLLLLFPACAPTAPTLTSPLACDLGDTCWLVNLPDVATGPEVRDHLGRNHSYDGHDGTDIAVPARLAGDAALVVAPADGVVLRLRDDVADGVQMLSAVPLDKACGNGLVMQLGGGWEAQLCHLRWSSSRVAPGEAVRRGQPLATVGWSGLAEMPHVHLTVSRDGRDVNPYTGLFLDDGSPAAQAPLWTVPDSTPALGPVFFAPAPPDPAWAWTEGVAMLSPDAPGLQLIARLWRPEIGDIIDTVVTAPDGRVTRGHYVVPQPAATDNVTLRRDRAAEPAWEGTWRAEVTWTRGPVSKVRRAEVIAPPTAWTRPPR